MAFSGTFGNLIANADEQNVLWRSLLQSFQDHGANATHLDRLLADAKGPRHLIDQLTKLAIGPVWKLIEGEPIDLGLTEEDFESSPKDFLSHYTQLDLRPNLGLDQGHWSEKNPHDTREEWRLRWGLEHSRRSLSFREVVEIPEHSMRGMDHAGWRELLAFVSRLQPGDFEGYRIIAAGSRDIIGVDRVTQRPRLGTVFPVADSYQGKISISWKGVEIPDDEERFENNHLYLMCYFG